MIVEIAVATHTAPRSWWDEDDATLATVLSVLADQAATLAEAAKPKAKAKRKVAGHG